MARFRNLLKGDPAPWFRQRSVAQPSFSFDTVGGRYIVLCFFTSGGDARARAAIAAVQAAPHVFNDTHASVTICPITSEVVDADLFRVVLLPGTRTGLDRMSQVMIDKIVSVPRTAVTRTIGHAGAEELATISEALSRWLDL